MLNYFFYNSSTILSIELNVEYEIKMTALSLKSENVPEKNINRICLFKPVIAFTRISNAFTILSKCPLPSCLFIIP